MTDNDESLSNYIEETSVNLKNAGFFFKTLEVPTSVVNSFSLQNRKINLFAVARSDRIELYQHRIESGKISLNLVSSQKIFASLIWCDKIYYDNNFIILALTHEHQLFRFKVNSGFEPLPPINLADQIGRLADKGPIIAIADSKVYFHLYTGSLRVYPFSSIGATFYFSIDNNYVIDMIAQEDLLILLKESVSTNKKSLSIYRVTDNQIRLLELNYDLSLSQNVTRILFFNNRLLTLGATKCELLPLKIDRSEISVANSKDELLYVPNPMINEPSSLLKLSERHILYSDSCGALNSIFLQDQRLTITNHGVINTPSSLALIKETSDAFYLFCASKIGDHSIIKILDFDKIEVMETIHHYGPCSHLLSIVEGRNISLLAACGGYFTGSLRSLRTGETMLIEKEEQLSGVKNLTKVGKNHIFCSINNKAALMSYYKGTLSLCATFYMGATLHCSQIRKGMILQVTRDKVIVYQVVSDDQLIQHRSYQILSGEIVAAWSSQNSLLVSTSSGYSLFNLAELLKLDSETLDLSAIHPSVGTQGVAAITAAYFKGEEAEVIVFGPEKPEKIKSFGYTLSEEEGIATFITKLRDGRYFIATSTGFLLLIGSDYQKISSINFANNSIEINQLENENSFIAVAKYSSIVTIVGDKIEVRSLIVDNAESIVCLESDAEHFSLLVATPDTIQLTSVTNSINNKPVLQSTTINTKFLPRRLLQLDDNHVAVLGIDNLATLSVINFKTGQEIASFSFEMNEIPSAILAFSNNGFFVASSMSLNRDNSLEEIGKLRAFTYSSGQLSLIHYVDLDKPIYSLAMHSTNGLLVGCEGKVAYFKFDATGRIAASPSAEYKDFIAANCIDVYDNYVAVGDVMKGLTLLEVCIEESNQEKISLSPRTQTYTSEWVSAVALISPVNNRNVLYAVMTTSRGVLNIFKLEINQKSRVVPRNLGSLNLGEKINTINKRNNRLFMVSNQGRVAVLVPIFGSQAHHLSDLMQAPDCRLFNGEAVDAKLNTLRAKEAPNELSSLSGKISRLEKISELVKQIDEKASLLI